MYKNLIWCFQVSPLRAEDSDKLFVSYVPPHASVTSQSLARWMTELLAQAGIDVSIFQQHSTRSAAAAFMKSKRKLSLQEICRLADWLSKSKTYETFYNRYVA